MKLYLVAMCLVALNVTASSAQQAKAVPPPPKPTDDAPAAAKGAAPDQALTTRKQKFSYALGMNIGTGLGNNLKKQSVDVDLNLVAQGLKDAMAGGKTRLTDDEAKAVLAEVQNEV